MDGMIVNELGSVITDLCIVSNDRQGSANLYHRELIVSLEMLWIFPCAFIRYVSFEIRVQTIPQRPNFLTQPH